MTGPDLAYLISTLTPILREAIRTEVHSALVQRALAPLRGGPVDKQFDIGQAIALIKGGHRVRRAGWNGKGMWLSYSPGARITDPERFWSPANKAYCAEQIAEAERNRDYVQGVEVLPCVTMKTATGEILMGWLASQSDLLATDWELAE